MHDSDQPHGESDGSGNASWGEKDWKGCLLRNDLEIKRFLACYEEAQAQPDRLDVAARKMGWENADWVPGDNHDEVSEEAEEAAELPYCIHQHPVYIVCRALHQHVTRHFKILCHQNTHEINPILATDMTLALSDTQHQMIMAINATDTGDLNLALVHMKRALVSINSAIGLLGYLPENTRERSPESLQAIEMVLFDLREVCLRVMADCRWEGPRP